MDDLISRQAAIDAIDKALSRTFIEPCGEMILKDLPSAQPDPHWIPCSERLPDKSGTYICNCVESGINHVTFIKWQSRYKRWDLNGRRTFWRVTAWKPIPEPWRGGQE